MRCYSETPATNLPPDLGGVSLEHSGRLLVHRLLGGRAAVWVQAAGGIPPRTCTKSQMIVTLTGRLLASYLSRWIWWLLPSTSATQACLGSRLSASWNSRAITARPIRRAHNLPESDSRVLQLGDEIEAVDREDGGDGQTSERRARHRPSAKSGSVYDPNRRSGAARKRLVG